MKIMPRRSRRSAHLLPGLGLYREVRHQSYNVARGMGNLLPLLEGNPAALLRRQGRRLAGMAFNQVSFGKVRGFGVLLDLLLIVLGRLLGSRGRL